MEHLREILSNFINYLPLIGIIVILFKYFIEIFNKTEIEILIVSILFSINGYSLAQNYDNVPIFVWFVIIVSVLLLPLSIIVIFTLWILSIWKKEFKVKKIFLNILNFFLICTTISICIISFFITFRYFEQSVINKIIDNMIIYQIIVLTIINSLIFIYMLYTIKAVSQHFKSNKKSNYYKIIPIKEAEINEILESLYLVYLLDINRHILKEIEMINKTDAFNPIYVYDIKDNSLIKFIKETI